MDTYLFSLAMKALRKNCFQGGAVAKKANPVASGPRNAGQEEWDGDVDMDADDDRMSTDSADENPWSNEV